MHLFGELDQVMWAKVVNQGMLTGVGLLLVKNLNEPLIDTLLGKGALPFLCKWCLYTVLALASGVGCC